MHSNNKNMDLNKEELATIIIGIRLQIDECDKQTHNYDPNVRKIFEDKMKYLYDLWKKLDPYLEQ